MAPFSSSIPRFSSVKTLLNGLFDYAGLFPPASLGLEAAIHEYINHRSGPDAWMMGPFVVPVGLLGNVISILSSYPDQAPITFDVLPRVAPTLSDLKLSLNQDLKLCSEFVNKTNGLASIDTFEFRFPPNAFCTGAQSVDAVFRIADIFDASDFKNATLFGEISRGESFVDEIPLFLLALASSSFEQKMFAKIRCGGMNQTDFPSPHELAHFIHSAIQISCPFKTTAGLHHPVRHFNIIQNATMHGFLNDFFATTLGRVHGLTTRQIQEILEDQNPSSFVFTPAGISWNDLSASNGDFIHDRKNLGLSIGSCSMDEPLEDLFELDWLSK